MFGPWPWQQVGSDPRRPGVDWPELLQLVNYFFQAALLSALADYRA